MSRDALGHKIRNGSPALAQEHHEYPRSTRLIEVQNIDVVGGVFHFEVSIVNAAPLVDNIGDVDVSSIELYA